MWVLRGKANPRLLAEGSFLEAVTLTLFIAHTHVYTHTYRVS